MEGLGVLRDLGGVYWGGDVVLFGLGMCGGGLLSLIYMCVWAGLRGLHSLSGWMIDGCGSFEIFCCCFIYISNDNTLRYSFIFI